MATTQFWRVWEDLRSQDDLPKLTPRDVRHWVSTACRKAGLSKAATAYLQGHDSSGGSTMRDWYDHITEHDAITEQAQVLPNGPIGTLLQPVIKIEGDVPDEAKALISSFMKDEIGELDLARKLGELKREMKESEVLKP